MKKIVQSLKFTLLAFAVGTGGLLAISPVMAGTDYSQYDPENIAQIDILPGWRQADGSHMIALRIQLTEGWKTYWRAPGDAGIPPAFDWKGSDNLRAVAFHWPVPEVFDTSGFRTVGYHKELILPIQLYPSRDGQTITVNGRVSLGVCNDVCVPMEARFSATLDANGEAAGANIVRAALAARPATMAEAGLRSVSCEVTPISDGLRVTARMELPRVGRDEFAVIETKDQQVWVSEADVRREGGMLIATSDLVAPASTPFSLARSDIRITVLAGGRGVDIASCAGS